MVSTHPLYIVYTSGTTGQPKGIVRDCGGTAVGLNYCMKNVFDVHQGSVHFAGSDIGWVVGHSFIVYGPLIRCATAIFFEGKPVTPDAGVMWRVCEQYKVTSLYMAPTGVRVVKKEDYDGNLVKKYDTSSIRTFCLVGERCDPDTIHWVHRHFPKVLINDTWWQTETGWPISANLLNLADFKTVFPTLPGSVTRSVPGYEVKIFDESNKEVAPDTLGKVVIKLPLPPAFMLTLWGNDQAFIEKYLSDTPGYYTTGDAGVIDSKGYLHIMTRMDDVINTAGHRISTGRLEEVINDHDSVVESAVVGYNHEIRGECPLAFVILKGSGCESLSDQQREDLSKEINGKVRTDVGAFARLEGVLFLNKLPKTRSGKILRGTIRKIVNSEEYNFPATIDDPTSLDLIKNLRDKYILKKEIVEEKIPSLAAKPEAPKSPAKPVAATAPTEKKNGTRPVSKEFEGKTPEEIKAIKKERAAKRKKAAEERFEPRQLRPRNKKVEEKPAPAKAPQATPAVGQKREAVDPTPAEPVDDAGSPSKIQKTE